VTVGAVASDDKRSVDDLISTADDRMYLGKLSGKNRVVSTDKTANEHRREQL